MGAEQVMKVRCVTPPDAFGDLAHTLNSGAHQDATGTRQLRCMPATGKDYIHPLARYNQVAVVSYTTS